VVLSIWQKCAGEKHVTALSQTVWRIVEAQEITATRKLVSSLDEQVLLEQMIEELKPPIPVDCAALHPLLYTPFSYPPLLHGSRFGKRHERSLWYGSLQSITTMAEVAYYRFCFLDGSNADYGVIVTQLTAFTVQIKTKVAIDLLALPFSKYTKAISSPVNYAASQMLGAAMREQKIQAFCYQSARDPEGGVHVALFNPAAFAKKKPDSHSFQTWQCVTDHRAVDFVRSSALEVEARQFTVDMFEVDGKLPVPAF
jgi:hypothetical protein